LLALLAFQGRRRDATSLRQERGIVGFEPSTMTPILLRAAGEIITMILSDSQEIDQYYFSPVTMTDGNK
jgi:hypothetical protein